MQGSCSQLNLTGFLASSTEPAAPALRCPVPWAIITEDWKSFQVKGFAVMDTLTG